MKERKSKKAGTVKKKSGSKTSPKDKCGAYDVKKDDSYYMGPVNYGRSADSLVSTYFWCMFLAFFLEMFWVAWPIAAVLVYGGKAFFAVFQFGPLVFRIIFVLRCLLVEKMPFRIAPTISTKPEIMTPNEGWLRFFGVYGQHRAHGTYMMFAKVWHILFIVVLVLVEGMTRQHFEPDYFWVWNLILVVVYIVFTYILQWQLLMFAVVRPREQFDENHELENA